MKKFIILPLLVFGLLWATAQQSITLLQPAAGVSWEGATTHTITWQAQNVNLLTIAFSADGGGNWQIVEEAYPATAQLYHWTVPAQPTTAARIRLSDTDNPAIYTVSGLFTIPEPFITLVQPENLTAGNAYAIRWQSSCIFNLNILFSSDDGNTWANLYSGVNAPNGIKNWPIPEAAAQCLLKLEDTANPAMFAVSAPFAIAAAPQINPAKYHGGSFDGYASRSNLPAQLALTFPLGGETFEGSIIQTLAWQQTNVSLVMMLFSANGGTTWGDTLQQLYPAGALQYAWTVPNLPTTQGRIKLISLDNPGLEAESGDFTILPPFVEITNSFGQLYSGTPYPVFWTSSSVEAVSLAYSADGGATWQTFAENVPALHGIKNWAVPEPTAEGKIRIWDAFNPEISDETDLFVINSLPPHNPTKYHGGSFDGYASKSNLPNQLTLTFPAGGETLEGSSLQTIRWERQNTTRIMLLLSLDGGLSWNDTLQALYPAEALQCPWTVPNTPTTAGRIKLVSLDSPGLESVSGDFTIPEPFLVITNTFTQLYTGTPYPVFWNSASVGAVSLAFSPDGGNTWQNIAENVPALRKIKNWAVPEPTAQGKIKVWDAANPLLFDETEVFVISSLPEHNPTKYHGGSYDGYASYVFKAAAFACPPDTSVCVADPAFEITGATPAGGTFTGTGVTGGIFDPSAAGTGAHEITYHYTYFNGSSTECAFFINVHPMPEVSCPGDVSVCVNEAAFPLSGSQPEGGTYTGDGVSGNIFDPALAGIGSHAIVYTFTSEAGCTSDCEFTITVNPLPEMTCPGDTAVCEDVAELVLPSAFPEGGTWQGNTVAGGKFYPQLAGVGSHVMTYTFADANGCENSCQFLITVNPLPEMDCPADFGICVDAGAIQLPPALPEGGTYTGAGVTGSQFDPTIAGLGTHPVSYQFTDDFGCTNQCTFLVTVHPLPLVTCPPDMDFCIDDAPFALTGVHPVGGIFTGNGVSGGIFNPAQAGVGQHEIVYQFTDANGCNDFCTFHIQVHPLPELTCPADKIVCISEPPFTLNEALPAGGVYTGQGVSSGVFNPQTAGAGDHQIVYTFTDENSCIASCNFTISVKPLPVVSCPGNFAVCRNDEPFQLTGGSPVGGVYSGIGVSGGMFYPGNTTTGIKNITYTFTDGFGCSNSCTFKITVLPVPVVSCPGDMSVCLNEEPFEITGLQPADGTLTGAGVNGLFFDPATAGVGTHELVYEYVSPVNFCVNTCTFNITVLPLPELTCGQNLSVCVDDAPLALTNGLPVGGTYTGTGVEAGFFDPETAGVGNHEIVYSYTSPETFCTTSCSFTISVLALPVLVCGDDFSVCLNGGLVMLNNAVPAGGSYSGNGVADGVFDPEVAGVGIHEIIYFYTSPETSCSNACGFFITVLPLPELSGAQDFSVCLDHEPVALSMVSPAGGTYSGTGVMEGTFYPGSAGVGNHQVTYTYTSPETNCTNTCHFQITVLPLPPVSCGSNPEICLNDEPLVLDMAQPSGGIYVGTGVESGVFYPEIAGVGTHTISYAFTGENGCSASCQFLVTVHPVQELSCPQPFEMCIYDEPLALNLVQPQGGIYEGTGVAANVFYPEMAGAGTHFITYQFQNEFGCKTSCEFSIEVHPKPEITCNFPDEVCLYDGPLYLEGCSPGGGDYTGNAVAGNIFFPEIAGVGDHVISYHYSDPATGCENQTEFTLKVLPAQLVSLPQGWMGISSCMVPKDPEIPEIFTDLGDKLVILYNLKGTIYYPGENIIPQELWDSYSGYALKTTQPVTMDFCGEYLQNLTVQLSQGWNLIPMLSKNQVSSEYLFGFNSKVRIVKEVAGWKLYWKEMGINTLGFVVPGEAYYVYCTDETSVTFPFFAKEEPVEIIPDQGFNSPFVPVEPTPSTHILAFENNISSFFSNGDIIGAFDESGMCAGQVQIGAVNSGLVIFGDDAFTDPHDGFSEGERIYYKLFRPENIAMYDIEFSFDENYTAGANFHPDGISVATSVKLGPLGLAENELSAVNIFPNPTTGILNIAGIEGSYTLEVYNVVQELLLIKAFSGQGQVDLSGFSKGVYLVKVVVGDSVVTRKVTMN